MMDLSIVIQSMDVTSIENFFKVCAKRAIILSKMVYRFKNLFTIVKKLLSHPHQSMVATPPTVTKLSLQK